MAVPPDGLPRFGRHWIPLALAPLAWMAQGATGWYLAGRACPAAAPPLAFANVRALVAVITLVSLACTVGAGVSAGRTLWMLAGPESPSGGRAERSRFPAMLGLLVSATLTLGLVLAGLPVAFLHVCGEAR
jgi:hypothetical protein